MFRFFIFSLFLTAALAAQPIALHPENPHYFIYEGEPTVLITSAEHYGAVLNTDFDFETYLQTLHDDGMNYTRIFTGSYVEVPGNFGITKNTLAPEPGSYIAPWPRTNEPGLFEGETKFDLAKWNPDYFERLHRFVALAQELDIIVEVTFFSSTYQDAQWQRNPFNPGNNINNLPADLDRQKSNTPAYPELNAIQMALVEKFVTELNDYDNVFYEIQNEPWSDDPQRVMRTLRTLDPNKGGGNWYKWAERASDASLEWQDQMVETITATEENLPKTHLIAQNYTNFKHSIAEIHDDISIINFHYAWPEAVWMNYGWDRAIGFDESGFAGGSDTTYLRQAWQFMLAGGALFNNLDYSFFTGAEDGSLQNDAPGGGSKTLRRQLAYLHDFIKSFNFIRMAPDFDIVYHAPGVQWQAISQPGRQYAVIFTGVEARDWVKLNLPKGAFNYEFVSPFTGEIVKRGSINGNAQQPVTLAMPQFDELLALRIK